MGRGKIATIGTFDGLHRGHRRVIDLLKSEASRRNLTPMVICFDRHPLETVRPERSPGFIMSPSERTNHLYKEGVEIYTVEFTRATASLSAEEWMGRMGRDMGVKVLIVGYDNTFGSDGISMNIEDYKRLGERTGIEVIEAPVEPEISSSGIRRALADGDIETASRMLGRPYRLTGEVVRGKALGATLGFPTANIEPGYRAQIPKPGVYTARALTESGDEYPAVVNIGVCPTVSERVKTTLEAHLIGFEGDLYGSRVTLTFGSRLRDEIKFDSVEELKNQISRDIETAKEKC